MGIIFDIQRCSVNDGPGLRTVVFFKGCPLKCLWCHNPESQSPKKELLYNFEKCIACGNCSKICFCHSISDSIHIIKRDQCIACGKCVKICPSGALEVKGMDCSAKEVFREIKKDEKYYRKSGGGVTISGGEPFLQPSFLIEILNMCRKEQIHTAIETSGFVKQSVLLEILPYVDLFLWDYKVTENSMYYIGANQQQLIENLHFAYTNGAHIRLRCPIIPGVGDNQLHLEAISELSQKYNFDGVDILPYHNMGVFKSRKLGRIPWDMHFHNMGHEKKNWIAEQLTYYGCRGFKIL